MKIAHSKPSLTGGSKPTSLRIIRTERPALEEPHRAPAWRLPGGMGLAEYALRGGFVASTLMAWSSRSR